MKLIGQMQNMWRERAVFIYEIEGDPDNVKTVGLSFHPNVKPVETVEPRSAFARAIAAFPNVYVYN